MAVTMGWLLVITEDGRNRAETVAWPPSAETIADLFRRHPRAVEIDGWLHGQSVRTWTRDAAVTP